MCVALSPTMIEQGGQDSPTIDGRRIPTIVFTADDSLDVSSQYASGSLVAYLRKPITSDDLLEAVARAVRGEPSSSRE